MASTQESLSTLEALMTEFFAPETTNERKRAIEEILNNFSQQQTAWKHCLYFMNNTDNQYVLMYTMTVLENLINRQWLGVNSEDKVEIRRSLNQYLLQKCEIVPYFIRNKLIKLVVDIGRLDWPHFYPDFFTNIVQLIQLPDTAVLGLLLLQTTSEELACPREDLSVARKEELRKLLLAQVPAILCLLNNLLESILEKHRHMVAATPPPSPTHGQTSDRSTMAVISSSPMGSAGLLNNMFNSPMSRVQTEALPPLDLSSYQIATHCLQCLAHLFSWIPLSATITPALLSTIFHFAGFGCESAASFDAHQAASSPSSNFPSFCRDTQTLGVQAMSCINELLAKNCVPAEFQDFLLQMFQQTFYLLQKLTKDSSNNTNTNKLQELDESYIEKFTEFLRLFVSIHLRRFEGNSQFPVLEFLALFFKYTFKQTTNESFYSCLDIWIVFLDFILTKLSVRSSEKDIIISKYKEALLSLVSQVLNKIQFSQNHDQLDKMDDATLDDDNLTEWQYFLCQCLEIVAKVAEIMPRQTLLLIYKPFQENADIYLGLEQYILSSTTLPIIGESTQTLPAQRLSSISANECTRLHCVLRDVSTLLQALGRMADRFIGEEFLAYFVDAYGLINRLVAICEYGSKMKFFNVCYTSNNKLQADFVEVHAQCLAALKANSEWLLRFHVESFGNAEKSAQCRKILTTIVENVVPQLDKQLSQKVVHSSAHLMFSMLTTVRAAYFMEFPIIQQLYNTASDGSLHSLTTEVQQLLYRALSHYQLLPWPTIPDEDQQWHVRSSNHSRFVKQLSTGYRALQTDIKILAENRDKQLQAKPLIKRTLHILKDLVESISAIGVHNSKQICYQSLHDLVQITLQLFPIYIQQADVIDDILGFFLSLFTGLRVEMGTAFTEQVIQTFLTMFSRQQLSDIIMQENTTAFGVIEKFLEIMEVIIQEPGSSFKAFLPNIISISMQHIYPVIAERSSPEIKPTLYRLMYGFLHNNWRYFFKSDVLSLVGMPQRMNNDMENQQEFILIMQAFGQSFLQPDIGVFRQNLESLELLNSNWKLYHKPLFREMMLLQFLNVLLQVLVTKSHDLLQEEIAITLYNMAHVDFDTFFTKFLPQFLNSCEGIDDNQKVILAQNFKMDKDLPSFTQGIHRMVNDLRFYRLCNTSLPEGTVHF